MREALCKTYLKVIQKYSKSLILINLAVGLIYFQAGCTPALFSDAVQDVTLVPSPTPSSSPSPSPSAGPSSAPSSSPSSAPSSTPTSSPTPTLLAPTGLTYSSQTPIYTTEGAITSNTPSSSGGTVASYSVLPALPTGLSLNASTGVISGTPTVVTGIASYTVTATNSAGSTTSMLSITVNLGPKVYLSDFNAANNYVCSLNTNNGSVVSCSTNLALSQQIGLIFGSNSYAYYLTELSVQLCTYSTTTGVLSSCSATAIGLNPYQLASGAFATLGGNNYLYGPDLGNNDVYVCPVSADGTIATGSGTCALPTPVPAGYTTTGVNVVSVGGTTYGYVASLDASSYGHVYVCAVSSSTGLLSSCTESDGGITVSTWKPYNIAIFSVGGNTYSYIADWLGNNIYLCSVSATTGLLSSCATSNGGIAHTAWKPHSINLQTFGSNSYAYIADNNGNIYTCSVSATTGVLSSCAISNGGATFTHPFGITVAN